MNDLACGTLGGEMPEMARNPLRLVRIRWLLTRQCCLAVVWSVVCAAGNFWCAQAVYQGHPPEPMISSWIGFIAAQIAWVTIWSVFGPWSLLQRGAYCAGVVLLLVCSAVLPEWLETRSYSGWMAHVRDLLPLPLLTLAVQSPLWIARTWFGWRLFLPTSAYSAVHSQPLGRLDLLLCLGTIACAVAAAGLSLPQPTRADPYQAITDMALVWSVLALAGLLIALPIAAAIFRTQDTGYAVILVILTQVLPLGLLIGGCILYAFLSWGAPTAFDALGVSTTVLVAFCVSLDLPLFIARGVGYRLHWCKWRSRVASDV
jgi:hypothetical protein